MTRPEDADFAGSLGADFVGVIFAGGPRVLTLVRAVEVLAPVRRSARVAVFGEQSVDEILQAVDWLQLAVVQLHGSATAERIQRIRAGFMGEIWPVYRVAGPELPAEAMALGALGHRLVLDSYVPGALGGTGVAMQWSAIKPDVDRLRASGQPVVLAGGLRPENVATAITTLSPDVVDVSSGVESAPGIKDHHRMRAFRDAVHALNPS